MKNFSPYVQNFFNKSDVIFFGNDLATFLIFIQHILCAPYIVVGLF